MASTRCVTPIVVDYAGAPPRLVEWVLGYALYSWDPGTRWFFQHVFALTEAGENEALFNACMSTLDAALAVLKKSPRGNFEEYDRATRFPEADDVRRVVRRAIVLARVDAQRQGR